MIIDTFLSVLFIFFDQLDAVLSFLAFFEMIHFLASEFVGELHFSEEVSRNSFFKC